MYEDQPVGHGQPLSQLATAVVRAHDSVGRRTAFVSHPQISTHCDQTVLQCVCPVMIQSCCDETTSVVRGSSGGCGFRRSFVGGTALGRLFDPTAATVHQRLPESLHVTSRLQGSADGP
jgi:hypothetical protein